MGKRVAVYLSVSTGSQTVEKQERELRAEGKHRRRASPRGVFLKCNQDSRTVLGIKKQAERLQ